jgi:hypothetical protein
VRATTLLALKELALECTQNGSRSPADADLRRFGNSDSGLFLLRFQGQLLVCRDWLAVFLEAFDVALDCFFDAFTGTLIGVALR